jgi:hypothetical protein
LHELDRRRSVSSFIHIEKADAGTEINLTQSANGQHTVYRVVDAMIARTVPDNSEP